jgi:hypothetical protein
MKKPAKVATARRKRNPEPDVNQLPHHLIKMTTEQPGAVKVGRPPISDSMISRVMAEFGRRSGKIGGKKRADAMTPERRRAIASTQQDTTRP